MLGQGLLRLGSRPSLPSLHPLFRLHAPRCCLDQVPRSWSLGLEMWSFPLHLGPGRQDGAPLSSGKASSLTFIPLWSVLTAQPQESVCPEINALSPGPATGADFPSALQIEYKA